MVHTPPPILEVYYSPTCAPCRLELPILSELVAKDGTRVRIVILDQEGQARHDIREVSPVLERQAVRSPDPKPRAALLAAGDADGILPFARAISPAGPPCATWRGGLTLQRARMLVGACRHLISPPKR